MIRDTQRWSKGAWAFSLVALAFIASFSLLAQADFIDHDNARWQAGYWLNARLPSPSMWGMTGTGG